MVEVRPEEWRLRLYVGREQRGQPLPFTVTDRGAYGRSIKPGRFIPPNWVDRP